jgi:hypothetical protein
LVIACCAKMVSIDVIPIKFPDRLEILDLVKAGRDGGATAGRQAGTSARDCVCEREKCCRLHKHALSSAHDLALGKVIF